MLKKIRKKFLDPSRLSGSAPEVNGVHSGERPILHQSFKEICLVVFCVNPANKPTNQQLEMGKRITSSAESTTHFNVQKQGEYQCWWGCLHTPASGKFTYKRQTAHQDEWQVLGRELDLQGQDWQYSCCQMREVAASICYSFSQSWNMCAVEGGGRKAYNIQC